MMNLLEMSISASVMVIVVLLVRFCGKKHFSKTFIIVLWDLIVVRALLPFQIPLRNIPIFRQEVSKIKMAENSIALLQAAVDEKGFNKFATDVVHKVGRINSPWKWQDVILFIWMTGAICLLIRFLRIYRREYKLLKQCRPVQNETAGRLIRKFSLRRNVHLYEGCSFPSPVTYGIFCPKIVLPEDLEGVSRVDIRNMVVHELVHIQRYDVAKRYILAAVLCVHWFNPLIWMMYHFYQEDQEMACDEQVLRKMAGQESKNYIYTMIKMSSKGHRLLTTTAFGGKEAGRRRILAAMNQKKMNMGSMLTAAALSLCLAFSFVTVVPNVGKSDEQVAELVDSKVGEENLRQLLPVYEGSFDIPVYDIPDYKAVLKDIEENYNDLSQELTEEQDAAVMIQTNIFLAEVLKRMQDSGEKLDVREQWLVHEYYGYDEKHPVTDSYSDGKVGNLDTVRGGQI